MVTNLLLSLFLSYLTFDVKPEQTIWVLSREDQGGFYAVARPAYDDVDRVFVSLDDNEDVEEEVEQDEAFNSVYGDFDIIEEEENGNLLLHSAVFARDDAPKFLIQNDKGFYYLETKTR